MEPKKRAPYLKEVSPKQRRLLKAHIRYPDDPMKACEIAGYNPSTRASAISIIHTAKKKGQETMAKELERAKLSGDWVLGKLVKIAESGSKDSDRIRALELLGKNMKMFTDKVEMTGKDGNDLFNMEKMTDDELDALIESASAGVAEATTLIQGGISSSDTGEKPPASS